MQAFVSYCHEDQEFFKEFMKHLRALERAYGFTSWADKRIMAGDRWTARIAAAIDASEIHILLMSAAFFASDFIYDKELPAIHDRYRAGALTLPVLVKRCSWATFVGVLQSVPMTPDGRLKAIEDWRPQSHGFHTACEQIGQAIGVQFELSPTSPLPWSRP